MNEAVKKFCFKFCFLFTGYGSGQPPENRLDLGPSGGLRTDARTLKINLSIKTRETEPSEM